MEWRDYVLIAIGIFAILASIYRFIIFSGTPNHVMSVFLIGFGFILFWMVYKRKGKDE